MLGRKNPLLVSESHQAPKLGFQTGYALTATQSRKLTLVISGQRSCSMAKQCLQVQRTVTLGYAHGQAPSVAGDWGGSLVWGPFDVV
jgi:hypothetical protein